MTARFSNPSSGEGINRFRVWPSGPDAFEHAYLAANWDLIDDIIGIPSGGDWPPTKGVNGGIYREVALLQAERASIGDTKMWFRPSASIPIPAGWVVMDGRTLAPSDHDFPGISTSVTIPNHINKFPLGADPDKAVGAAAAAVGSGQENSASGAPGVGATGGLNSVTLTEAQIAPHDHGGVDSSVGFDNQAVPVWESGPRINVLLGGLFTNEQGTHHHVISSDGGGQAHENRPEWVGLIPLLKVKFITSL